MRIPTNMPDILVGQQLGRSELRRSADAGNAASVSGSLVSRRSVLRTALVSTMAIQSGCLNVLSPPPIEDVEISIFDVRTPSIGVTSATIPVVLQLHNPTQTAIPNPTAEFDVHINGELSATMEASFNTLDPGEQTKEEIRIIIEYSRAGAGIAKAIEEQQLELLLWGQLRSKGATTEVKLYAE